MEELKVIMEAFAQLGEGAQTAFIIWCIKETLENLLLAGVFSFLGYNGYKLVRYWQKWEFKQEK
jgi:hypothetical protein